jgi:hypothetical protein
LAIAAGVRVNIKVPETFAELHAGYHYNLDTAQSLLKIACSVGTPLDVSDRPVAHDIRLICDPGKLRVSLGDKQRARDVLMATDFYDECGHMPGVHVSKITVPIWDKPTQGMPTDMLAKAYENPTWRTLVVASFENAADAVLYRLTAA